MQLPGLVVVSLAGDTPFDVQNDCAHHRVGAGPVIRLARKLAQDALQSSLPWLGFLADLLSKPVLVGYMAGVAVLMAMGQLQKLTGVSVHGNSFVTQVRSFARGLGDVHGATLALGTP